MLCGILIAPYQVGCPEANPWQKTSSFRLFFQSVRVLTRRSQISYFRCVGAFRQISRGESLGIQKRRVHEVDSVTRQPEVTILVTSYNRRQHLRRCLLSLSRQRGLVHHAFEVVVADVGSSDGSCEMLRHLSRDLPYRVRVVSQEDLGFRRARALNQALKISEGDYLLLTDADCIFPNHYVQRQIADRKVGVAWAGDCIRLNKEVTQRITEGAIVSGDFMRLVPTALTTDQMRDHYKNRLYQWWNHPTKPKLIGFNIALWADDLRSINGFDQNFVGWGCEDDDLALRLRKVGVKIKSNANRTFGYHLWHEQDSTVRSNWNVGANVNYLQRPVVLARCLHGLNQERLDERLIRFSFEPTNLSSQQLDVVQSLQNRFLQPADEEQSGGAELEVRFGNARVSSTWASRHRVQIMFDGERVTRVRPEPHLVLDLANHSAEKVPRGLRLFDPESGDNQVEEATTGSNVPVTSDASPEGIADWLLKQLEAGVNGQASNSELLSWPRASDLEKARRAA